MLNTKECIIALANLCPDIIQSESFFLDFLPLDLYRRVLEVNNTIILGDKGTGKSVLFRALNSLSGRKAIVKTLKIKRIPSLDKVHWLGINQYPEPLIDWQQLILKEIISNQIVKNIECETLNSLDNRLKEADEWLFITLDNVDNLPKKVINGIYNLFRWERIVIKVFTNGSKFHTLHLTSYLNRSFETLELEWKISELYELLLKRVINSIDTSSLSREFYSYKHSLLGYIPNPNKVIKEYLIEQIIGRYPDNNPLNGTFYNWIKKLKDSNSRISPKVFIKYLSTTAQNCLSRVNNNYLINIEDLKEAFLSTSIYNLNEIIKDNNELEPIRTLFEGQSLPINRKEFIALLESIHWSSRDIEFKLEELGIIKKSKKYSHINIPPIYRYSLGVPRLINTEELIE